MTEFDPEACERRFIAFFKAVHGREPFPWQRRLAVRVCDPRIEPAETWPRAIALPTAAGKTACIDIAVFALAYRADVGLPRTAPRRIFFVVDRRIVVDQAHEHARRKLAPKLAGATSGVLREVADALRSYGGGNRPLDVYALRGGMYREDTWVRSPLQPTVVTSTVDQVGSRLLFRGYGVSDSMKPIHAGLVGNDALILLDEAHGSKPFAETAEAVQRYRSWRDEESGILPALAPFAFVQMTATPGEDVAKAEDRRKEEDSAAPSLLFELDFDPAGPDLGDKTLRDRVVASKPARLVVSEKAKGKKGPAELVLTLAGEARGLRSEGFAAVGVIVNRVVTARDLRAELARDGVDVILLTGRTRPLDRDAILEKLGPLFSGASGAVPPTYVVATQCLEVGADLDFHALVSECASLDALRQRFGRLNRVAARDAAGAVVVVRADQAADSEDDPVYGVRLAETWRWLNAKAAGGVFDFGVAAVRAATLGEDLARLNAPAASAPALLPAHLDCWVQTSPRPMPDPDPAPFLHGPKSGEPDVQVVFRADLGDDPEQWAEVVSLCPPSSSEALPVRSDVFRRWIGDDDRLPDDLSDVEGVGGDEDAPPPHPRRALRWAGPDESAVVEWPGDIRPQGMYVVPASAGRLDLLGDFPPEGMTDGAPTDRGDAAFQRSRDRVVLRLPGLDLDPDAEDFEDRLTAAIEARLTDDSPAWLKLAVEHLRRPRGRTVAAYPAPLVGFVVSGKGRLHQFDPTFADDESSESPTRRQVTLADHTRGVMAFADRFAAGSGLPPGVRDRFALAARWHDLGKADPRFQAMLRGGSPRSATGRELLAKSGAAPESRRERDGARAVHLYPKGGRHELLSVAFAAERTDDDLVLHLAGTHHGDGRPFAAPYEDATVNRVGDLRLTDVPLLGERFRWPRAAGDPATANATAPDRFWRVVRSYGWWGSAYLETLFRLADHAASRSEQEEGWEAGRTPCPEPPAAPRSAGRRTIYPVELTGLDGSNPLAFLTALGALRSLDALSRRPGRPDWLDGGVKLSWGRDGAPFGAVLHLAGSPGSAEVVACLAGELATEMAGHPAEPAISLVARKGDPTEFLRDVGRAIDPVRREAADWATALHADWAPGAKSQLLIVRRDNFPKNIKEVIRLTSSDHLERALFRRWDYADPLKKQSLHWDPSEDRRHAYQWNEPEGDPTRSKRGGMLGANRLALEAWPLLQSVSDGKKLWTRGFSPDRDDEVYWTWPIWSHPLGMDAATSLLALAELQAARPTPLALRGYRVFAAFRCRRILVGKTPNLTPAASV